ncbi:hypothetical protein B0T22DRAFT_451642 [Podospora appendiculata]|uniref:COMPASS component SDC1 n=1 Tax=Podospora appendiculata TaxID=314037 RepID=A0AAE0XIJ9_9PEZI|nr:hypothetical protein B0T22DRAFT_451642 [Podospora appendiculata]
MSDPAPAVPEANNNPDMEPAETRDAQDQADSSSAPLAPTEDGSRDINMVDAPSDQPAAAASPFPAAATLASTSANPAATPSNAPSPLPARVGTPMRNTDGERAGSRAASAHPDSGFAMPAEAPVHGAPVRQYINTKITGVLLEGMKMVARDQPKDPLRVLGEFLLQRSKELEGAPS